jgi:hypothetical protein
VQVVKLDSNRQLQYLQCAESFIVAIRKCPP